MPISCLRLPKTVNFMPKELKSVQYWQTTWAKQLKIWKILVVQKSKKYNQQLHAVNDIRICYPITKLTNIVHKERQRYFQIGLSITTQKLKMENFCGLRIQISPTLSLCLYPTERWEPKFVLINDTGQKESKAEIAFGPKEFQRFASIYHLFSCFQVIQKINNNNTAETPPCHCNESHYYSTIR